MMMRMLEAGGMAVMTDHIRKADDDNPKGYYEYERVKSIKTDTTWLNEAEGKAVKMISALLTHLPPSHSYQVIFMRRKMEEVLASQQEMLRRRGKTTDPSGDGRMTCGSSLSRRP